MLDDPDLQAHCRTARILRPNRHVANMSSNGWWKTSRTVPYKCGQNLISFVAFYWFIQYFSPSRPPMIKRCASRDREIVNEAYFQGHYN
jgi:hypothetical protein